MGLTPSATLSYGPTRVPLATCTYMTPAPKIWTQSLGLFFSVFLACTESGVQPSLGVGGVEVNIGPVIMGRLSNGPLALA